MLTSAQIAERIFEALLARKLESGSRIGEQDLATVFGCSRTLVREALTRLTARGLVSVSPRRGWYVVETTRDQAREVFDARRIIEVGLLRNVDRASEQALERLERHTDRQRRAVSGSDVGLRSFLLGDFHVCLAQCLGNTILAETLRDLTVRTTLAAMRFQSEEDADRSFREHLAIVGLMRDGDMKAAAAAMSAHLGSWEAKLPIEPPRDALSRLRDALEPMTDLAHNLNTRLGTRERRSRPVRSPS